MDYHHIIDSQGIRARLRQLVGELDHKFGTDYSTTMSVTYSWPRKFETVLYNGRGVLEAADKSVETPWLMLQVEPHAPTLCARSFHKRLNTTVRALDHASIPGTLVSWRSCV